MSTPNKPESFGLAVAESPERVLALAEAMRNVDPLSRGARFPRAINLTNVVEPMRFSTLEQVKDITLESLAHRASDIYIMPLMPVMALIGGRMWALTKRVIEPDEIKLILNLLANKDTGFTDIVQRKPVNCRFEAFDPELVQASGERVRHAFRVNAVGISFQGSTSAQIVIRPIPKDPPTFDQVGLSEDVVRKMTPANGIVYVCGSTGSGKSTTFAAIVRYIIENDTPIKGSIITAEEPIEFVFDGISSDHSFVVQTQIPTQQQTFYEFGSEAMRRHPHLIMIGELRDEQTIRSAVELSLTGHPVFATVHASTVANVGRRLITRFPENERATAIADIMETARFMMCQRLVRTVSGGLTAAREWLEFTPEIRDALLNETDTGRVTNKLRSFVQEEGHSFAREARRLLSDGTISAETALLLTKAS